jgi:RTX calcium-binding nonapeptide repeat (4 copies)
VRGLWVVIVVALAAPASASAHSLARVGGGQVNYISSDATSLNTLEVGLTDDRIDMRDRTVDGGIDPGPCQPGEIGNDANAWVLQVLCPRSGIGTFHADLGEREDSATISLPFAVVVLGGPGADRLESVGDSADRLEGGDGNDRILAGPAADTLDGGLGADVLDAGAGDDLLRTRDGLADGLACGAGHDRVEADTADVVAADCESVEVVAVAPPDDAGAADDAVAPVVRAGAATLQRLGRRARIRLAATSSERGYVAASGMLQLPGLNLPLQAGRRRIPVAGAGAELTARLRGHSLRAARRALRRGRRVFVRMTVVATDAAGNSSHVKAPRIRLRR